MQPKAVFIGMPASGKTRAATELAKVLGVKMCDLDREVEKTSRKTVAEIFTELGETKFRDLEHQQLKALLQEFGGILSLGGGAPILESNQHLLEAYKSNGGLIIYLDVPSDVAVGRIVDKNNASVKSASVPSRPMFASLSESEVTEKWSEIKTARGPIYNKLSNVRVWSPEADETAKLLKPLLEAKRVGCRDYDVWVGERLLNALPSELQNVNKVAVIHTKTTKEYAKAAGKSISEQPPETEVHFLEVPDAEEAKTVDCFERMLEELAKLKFTRNDAIVAVGGGCVTDFAGFLAASYLRGIDFINVPTTLLAQVDASVGGKTGINLKSGKNLCGAFYEPKMVLCDINVLKTLPEREMTEGFGEIIKMGFAFDEKILELTEKYCSGDRSVLPEIIWRCVTGKAKVVESDFREAGGREFLNFGHTLGHAIEKLENYKWRHGEAVAVGMVFAMNVSLALAIRNLEPEENLEQLNKLRDDIINMLIEIKLPTFWDTAFEFEDALEVMKVDKKARGDSIRMVLLRDQGEPYVAKDIPEDILREAFGGILV